eukprot:6477141-Amphidinium_carterae.2
MYRRPKVVIVNGFVGHQQGGCDTDKDTRDASTKRQQNKSIAIQRFFFDSFVYRRTSCRRIAVKNKACEPWVHYFHRLLLCRVRPLFQTTTPKHQKSLAKGDRLEKSQNIADCVPKAQCKPTLLT